MDDGPAVDGTIWAAEPSLHVMAQSFRESVGQNEIGVHEVNRLNLMASKGMESER
jgi:hypothetical protein